MKHCYACNTSVEPEATMCPECEAVFERTCHTCGAAMCYSAKTCPNCGSAFHHFEGKQKREIYYFALVISALVLFNVALLVINVSKDAFSMMPLFKKHGVQYCYVIKSNEQNAWNGDRITPDRIKTSKAP